MRPSVSACCTTHEWSMAGLRLRICCVAPLVYVFTLHVTLCGAVCTVATSCFPPSLVARMSTAVPPPQRGLITVCCRTKWLPLSSAKMQIMHTRDGWPLSNTEPCNA